MVLRACAALLGTYPYQAIRELSVDSVFSVTAALAEQV